MTLNEIAYNILNLPHHGRLSDDYRPSIRQIKFIIKYWRASLIRRDIDKNTLISSGYVQSLGCQPLIIVDEVECCGYETGCKILRTQNKMPKPVRMKDGPAIWAYKADGVSKIDLITNYDSVPFQDYRKYKIEGITAEYRNDYIYVRGDLGLKVILPKFIGEDPTSASQISTCSGSPCYTDNDDFPIPMDMVQQLTQAILAGEIKIVSTTPEDTTNDSNG